MEPDFPCLADKKAEPCPDMNIKVTAFTESKKIYYMQDQYSFSIRVNSDR